MSSSLKLVKSINGEHYTCKNVFNNYKIRRKCINPELLQNLKVTIEKRSNQNQHFVGWIFSCISQQFVGIKTKYEMNYCVCKIIFNFYKFDLRPQTHRAEDCFTRVVCIFFMFSSTHLVQLITRITNIKEFLEDLKPYLYLLNG